MILITGGLGFIGAHTARALLDLGESCVLVQRREAGPPAFLADEVGRRIFLERVDLADRERFLEIGKRYPITGIVHLAWSVPWPPGSGDPVDGARTALDTLVTVVEAARAWGVRRVSTASTIGVYSGTEVPPPLREELPLPLTAGHVIGAFKKIGELLTDYFAGVTGIDLVAMRIAAIWGPLGREASPFFPAPQLVHAAARGTAPDLSALFAPAYADDGIDLCYVKDCGRAIALLQLSEKASHRVVNVGSGRLTTNRDLLAAIAEVAPSTTIELPPGRNPEGPAHDMYLDISRLQQDTGYQPAFDVSRAVADYVAWLRAGNPR